MRARVAALLATAPVVVAGCGGGHEISADGSARLDAVVADLRAAAGARDALRVRADLQQVRDIVGSLQREGDISDDRAALVLASAAEVKAAVGVITTTTTQPVVHGKHDDGD